MCRCVDVLTAHYSTLQHITAQNSVHIQIIVRICTEYVLSVHRKYIIDSVYYPFAAGISSNV
jgi:hypothetical protein